MDTSYQSENFTDEELRILRPYFTNLTGPVFALTNLPEVVKGALFARYSRSPLSLRRLFLKEFVVQPELGLQAIASAPVPGQPDTVVGTAQAEQLYRRVFSDYGDDSVAQLGGVHLACEQASNLLTKVLEWGRLAAYLEQSTRYIRYDQRVGQRWRYFVPPELASSPLRGVYCDAVDGLFDAYSTIAAAVTAHFERIFPCGDEAPGVWRATLRAKACDIARGLLPLSTQSNVGIYANGQAFESMIQRMRAHELGEARTYAELMLKELSGVIPAFMARLDVPEKGLAATAHLEAARRATQRILADLGLPVCAVPADEDFVVKLVDWDPLGEHKILADVLFSQSHVSLGQARDIVRAMPEHQRQELMQAYVGPRTNRRHKPGRAFEAAYYQFEVTCDYANFRDLQRHRMLTIEWQLASPIHGFTMPALLAELGLADIWQRAIEKSVAAYRLILEAMGPDVAQYVLAFCTRVRFQTRMNAREAMHYIELRTAKGGHSQYRQVCHAMLRELRQTAGHDLVADAMSYADLTHDYEFARLEGERRAARKREQAGLQEAAAGDALA